MQETQDLRPTDIRAPVLEAILQPQIADIDHRYSFLFYSILLIIFCISRNTCGK